MQEYGADMQQWWEAFKRSSVNTQITQGNSTRKLEKNFTNGLTSLSAKVETIEETYVDATEAYALAEMAISAELTGPSGSIYAIVKTEEIARVSADTALASRASALEASVDTPTTGLLARVSTIESSYVDAAGATAIASSTIAAELTGPSGSIYSVVQTEASARATADGNLAGQYVLRVAAGNVVTGMKVLSVTDPNAGDTSEITFQADKFQVYNGTTGLSPFQIVGSKIRLTGNVEIDGSLVLAGSLSLTNLADKSLANLDSTANTKLAGIDAGADVTLSKLNDGLSVTGGGITLSAGGALKGGASSFGSGVGWFLGYEGGQYKFRVGDPAGSRIEWDGSSWNAVSFPGGSAPTYTVSLVNNETTNPIYAPTGGGTYTVGQRVSINAITPVEPGSKNFTHWSGVDSAVNALDSPTASSTYVTVIGDMTLYANYA